MTNWPVTKKDGILTNRLSGNTLRMTARQNDPQATKILYIAGYGRSGSTLLDIVLSGHPEITGVGEITFLLEDWANGRHCSCGKPYRECDLWKDLFSTQTPIADLTKLVRKIEKRSSVLRLLLHGMNREDCQAYRAYQQMVLTHIISRTNSSIVVDSSKSARSSLGRFIALSKLVRQDVFVIHLIRDGLAVMESQVVTGDNWALLGQAAPHRWPALRTAFGWVLANIWVPLLGRLLGPDRYMLLRYEDLIEDPAAVLQAIGQFCGFDADILIDRINREDSFNVGHIVGGNRVRLEEKLTLKRPTSRKSGRRLKPHQRVLFACLGGWLQYSYGYNL